MSITIIPTTQLYSNEVMTHNAQGGKVVTGLLSFAMALNCGAYIPPTASAGLIVCDCSKNLATVEYIPLPGLSNQIHAYNVNTLTKGCVDVNGMGDNLSRLESFLKLKDNWNQNGAAPISTTLVSLMKYLVCNLKYQPEIFPTACDSIQFEYEKTDGDYLEFELREDKSLSVFRMKPNGEDCSFTLDFDTDKVNEVVSDFYDREI